MSAAGGVTAADFDCDAGRRPEPFLKRHIFHHEHHWAIHQRLTTRLWVATLAAWMFAGASGAVEWIAGRIAIDFAIGMDRYLGPWLVVMGFWVVWERMGSRVAGYGLRDAGEYHATKS